MERENKTTFPDGTFQRMQYDHWTTTITNTNGIATNSESDAFGRTIQITEHNGAASFVTDYVYDVNDRLTTVKDSAAPRNITNLTYDWLGQKQTIDDPDMGQWAYAYDAVGNLLRQTDANGKSVCFGYDALNRVTSKTARNGSTCAASVLYTVSYGYDEGTGAQGQTQIGWRTSMTDPSGSASWQYDRRGRVTQASKTITGAPANPYETLYTYNDLDQVASVQYPAGEVVTTTYNNRNLPAALTSTLQAFYVSGSAYNASDQLTSLTLSNGVVTTYGYDVETLRLASLQTGTGGALQNLGYTYDAVGNVKTLTDAVPLPVQVTTYNYDDLSRLKDATLPGVYTHTWTYSSIGNMLTRNDNNGNATYQYNDANHAHAVTQTTVNGVSKYYCYDANGNMTKRGSSNATCTSGGDTLTYDTENRLTSITVSGTTSYVYDGDGNRVKKTVGSTSTYYVGNYYEVTNGAVTKYYYFGKQRVAMKVGSAVTYLHGDHLGSTSVTTNASGQCTSAQWLTRHHTPRDSISNMCDDASLRVWECANACAALWWDRTN